MLPTRSHLSGRDEQYYLAIVNNKERSCSYGRDQLEQVVFSEFLKAGLWQGRKWKSGRWQKVKLRWSVQENVLTRTSVVFVNVQ